MYFYNLFFELYFLDGRAGVSFKRIKYFFFKYL